MTTQTVEDLKQDAYSVQTDPDVRDIDDVTAPKLIQKRRATKGSSNHAACVMSDRALLP